MENSGCIKEDLVPMETEAVETVDDNMRHEKNSTSEKSVHEPGVILPDLEHNEAMETKDSEKAGDQRSVPHTGAAVEACEVVEVRQSEQKNQQCCAQKDAAETSLTAVKVSEAVETSETEAVETVENSTSEKSIPEAALTLPDLEHNEAMETKESEEAGDQSSTPHTEAAVEACEAVEVRQAEQEDEQRCRQKDAAETSVTAVEASQAMETRQHGEDGDACQSSRGVTEVLEWSSPLLGGGGSLALLSMQYRDDSSDLTDSESDSSDSSSTSSSSSSSSSSGSIAVVKKDFDPPGDDDDGGSDEGLARGKKAQPVRIQNKLLIEELPAVENLTISLPQDTEIEIIGVVSSIIDQLVIVESKKDSPPLNDESVLFNKDRLSIGRVFEVFGPVFQPYYILRFNSQEEIEQKDLKISEPVFFAPKVKDFTDYIFTEQLQRAKGSDASWKNDQEPPPEALDFSDDEQERQAKQKLKEQKRQQHQPSRNESDSESEPPARRPPPSQKPPRGRQRHNWNPQPGRAANHNLRGDFHQNYHANPHFRPGGNPHFQPEYTFPPPGPYQPPFRDPGYSNYPRHPPPPPPHMNMNLNRNMGPGAPPPYPGVMFPFPPPPPPPSN